MISEECYELGSRSSIIREIFAKVMNSSPGFPRALIQILREAAAPQVIKIFSARKLSAKRRGVVYTKEALTGLTELLKRKTQEYGAPIVRPFKSRSRLLLYASISPVSSTHLAATC